jgi:ribulose-phosphate 3-epimerase
MIENVDTEAIKYAELGPHSITFHIEASKDPVSTCRKLRAMGIRAAIAIKPNTPVSSLSGLLEEIDMLLVMTVEPGFGGQKLIAETMPKVAEARALITSSKFEIALQVDGGVTLENIAELASLGADTFVAGSSVFGSSDHAQRILELRKSAVAGLNQ